MIHAPPADSDVEQQFYQDMQARFAFNPRPF
jgi:hypothetical protein